MSQKKIIWDRILLGELKSFLICCSAPGRLFFNTCSAITLRSSWTFCDPKICPIIWFCRCNHRTRALAFPRGLGRPHSPTETVRFTLAASLVWVSALPNAPEANSHLLLSCTSTSIHSQCAGAPAHSPQSSVLQSFLFAASPAKHCLWGRNGQMSRSAHDWQSTALTSPSLTLALLQSV